MGKIQTDLQQGRLQIYISRPEKANALDRSMAHSLSRALKTPNRNVRMIVIEGIGKNLSAGADLQWLLDEKNLMSFAEMYWAMLACPLPIVVVGKGINTGGALGLLAASDVAIGTPDSQYRLTETLFGLSPGIITPIVAWRVGSRRMTGMSLLHTSLNASLALEYGLLSTVEKNTKRTLDIYQDRFAQATPAAIAETKKMLLKTSGLSKSLLTQCAKASSALVKTASTQLRIREFLER